MADIKKYLVQKTTPLPGGSTMVMTMEMDKDQFTKYQADQKKKLTDAKSQFDKSTKAAVEKNGGQDIIPIPADWKNPGKKELVDSIKTLEPFILNNKKGWLDIHPLMHRQMHCLIATGKPPSDVSARELAKFKADAEKDATSEAGLMISASTAKMMSSRMVPNYWLCDNLRLVLTRQSVRSDVMFRLGQSAFGSSNEACWARAVAHQNGAVKTLWEVLNFCCNKDGTIMDEYLPYIDKTDENGKVVKKGKRNPFKEEEEDQEEEEEEEEEEEDDEKKETPKTDEAGWSSGEERGQQGSISAGSKAIIDMVAAASTKPNVAPKKRKVNDDEEDWAPDPVDSDDEGRKKKKKAKVMTVAPTPKKKKADKPKPKAKGPSPPEPISLFSSSGNPSVSHEVAESVLVD